MATNVVVVTGVTDYVTGTFDLTSPGFGTVQAAIIISSRAAVGENPTTGGPTYAIGLWDGVNNTQLSHRMILTNNAASSSTSRVMYNDRIISYYNDDYLTCANVTDGLRFTHSKAGSFERYVTAILFNNLSNVKAFTKDLGSGTAEQDINTVGFKPSLMVFINAGINTLNTVGTDGQLSFGIAHNSSTDVLTQRLMIAGSATAKGSGDPYMRPVNNIVAAQLIDASFQYTVTVSNVDADGFSITCNTNAGGGDIGILALELDDPDDVWVDFIQAATVTGNTEYTGVGFKPGFLGLVGGLATTTSSITAKMSFSFGATDGSAERSIAIYDEDLADPTNNACEADLSNVLAIYNDDGIDLATASLSSFDNDGFTLNYTLAGSAYYALAFAIKAPPAPPSMRGYGNYGVRPYGAPDTGGVVSEGGGGGGGGGGSNIPIFQRHYAALRRAH